MTSKLSSMTSDGESLYVVEVLHKIERLHRNIHNDVLLHLYMLSFQVVLLLFFLLSV